MLQSGGFRIKTGRASIAPIMMFLQLRTGNVRVIQYDVETTAMMIRAATDKTTELFNMYSAGGAPYEYHQTGDAKYRAYDDFARIRDN